jgi:ABC-type multidrug transport system fused ATPase/permease subunit
VGVLAGTPLVLAQSVRDNLRLRCTDATDDELARATHDACFDEVIARLPNGQDTQLEANGTNLSGGERQRLGLAQALLGEPQVLFLDEATCSLDADTEARVLERVLARDATVLSVAHRPAVIAAADRVFFVNAGDVEARPVHRRPPSERPVQPQPYHRPAREISACKLQLVP